jgi:hypothetical protein
MYIVHMLISLKKITEKRITSSKNIFQKQLGTWMEFRVGSVTSPELEFLNNLWARNRVGIGLSYRHTRLHRLAEFIPWNRFLGSMFSTLKNSGTGPTDSIRIMFQCLMTTFTRTLLLGYSLKGTVQLK